jgi:hypothetical protein
MVGHAQGADALGVCRRASRHSIGFGDLCDQCSRLVGQIGHTGKSMGSLGSRPQDHGGGSDAYERHRKSGDDENPLLSPFRSPVTQHVISVSLLSGHWSKA